MADERHLLVQRQGEVAHSEEPAWTKVPNGLEERTVGGVFLGHLVGPDGYAAGDIDESLTEVPEAGIQFGVAQAPHGPTFLFAIPMPGYTAEALTEKEGRPVWQGAPDWDKRRRVTVDSAAGKLGTEVPLEDILHTNYGNPGVRMGVLRVTDTEGIQKHYAMGADFLGEPENWQVTGGIVEVRPHPDFANLPSAEEIRRIGGTVAASELEAGSQ